MVEQQENKCSSQTCTDRTPAMSPLVSFPQSSNNHKNGEEWRNARKSKKFSSYSSSFSCSYAVKRETSRGKGSSNGGNSSRYLRPGALAQLRDARINTRGASSSSSCTTIGRKRVLVMDYGKSNNSGEGEGEADKVSGDAGTTESDGKNHAPSPQKKMFLVSNAPLTPVTPKTPKPLLLEEGDQDPVLESRLESLPFDLLIRILCLLHHDQLKTVFHVSQRLRKVALVARQCYFNYTTPDRSRQEMLRLTTPHPDEHWPFSDGVGSGGFMQCPLTPKAPRHDHRPLSRLSLAEMRQISASLFQGPASRIYRKKPPGLPRPGSKSLPSHRVLFYEDELCQAVAQNTLH